MLLDLLVISLVIFVFQLPTLRLVAKRDQRIEYLEEKIQGLQNVLLRVEQPAVAAVVSVGDRSRPEPEPLTDKDREQIRARQDMFKV